MPHVLSIIVAALLSSAGGPAPWADSRLDVQDGLILWLDASAINRSREAMALPPIPSGGSIDFWPDASVSKGRVSQPVASCRPSLLSLEGGRSVVRFDGKDDSLGSSGPERSTKEFTLFVVAAPRINPGLFRAFFATNAPGRNDYTSGMTLDQGGGGTARFEAINVEGLGFGGGRDLMTDTLPFGSFQVIEARAKGASVTLAIGGKPQGKRERKAESIRLDEITIGARFYANDGTPPAVGSSLDGDIAEVLLYNRALSDDEVAKVRTYLKTKHDGLDAIVAKLADPRLRPLKAVDNAPPVQMLVPGFAVRVLPLKLPNLNNLRYRHDGKLMALAYNGDVLILSDTDGDDLEDHSETFWAGRGKLRGPIGMCLTPPGYARGSGVFVASKGKGSLIVDKDGDDRADEEIIVAEGWPELPVAVDALGVAIDTDGSLFFGLGTGDYTNGYLVGKDGRADYRLDRERGAIIKVSPDFKRREIISTGIRFPVGLAFNAKGDLFATDQEGATWLPNGNPFDELLHIQTQRHYGFPPRHPKHLNNVIDEPSTFDYAPQHQSTCGLTFNDPMKPGAPIFGPDSWQGDALVCGYSRGKLWRTELFKTDGGYIARNSLIAALDKLTVETAIAPDGSLTVACHSGQPDWGTGPEGEGTLYKIKLADRERAQPVAAWTETPREVRVAFDRPINPEDLAGLASGTTIEAGRALSAGDRFETLRPGYAVVGMQTASPRFAVAVRGVSVTPDRRTLIIATESDTRPISHAITMPDPSRRAMKGLKQSPEIDLAYDLTGATATLHDVVGTPNFSGRIPSLDLDASRAWTRGVAGYEVLDAAREGIIKVEARLDLRDLLRPAVQPGAKLDYALPAEDVTLRVAGSGDFKVNINGDRVFASKAGEPVDVHLGEIKGPVDFEVSMMTAAGSPPSLTVRTFTADDPRPRPIPLRRILRPWARFEDTESAASEASAPPPELAGGDWARGRTVFFSDEAKCARCHAVNGQGAKIGPDLGNLIQRDYASVVRDIREPNAAIHPDHLARVFSLKDGRVVTGSTREEGGKLLIGDSEGRILTISPDDIEESKPSPASTMPQGLLEALGAEKSRDLLTYLMTPGLEPAPIRREGAPPPRSSSEVETMLKALPASDPKTWKKELKILLVAGPKDHGVNEHDYPEWKERWSKLLPLADGVKVRTAELWPSDEDFAWADAALFFSSNAGWTAERGKVLDAFLAKGGGLVYLHWAVNGHDATEALADRIGLASRPGVTKWRHGKLALDIVGEHPITAGIKAPEFEDESYWEMVGDPSKITILATAPEEGKPWPMLWSREQGKGRAVGCILGHYSWTFDDPLFRAMILRSIAWTAHEPTDRLDSLTTIGARIAPAGGDRR